MIKIMENREHDNDYKYTCSYFPPLHCPRSCLYLID